MSEHPIMAAERHPIQGLLDEADGLGVIITDPQGQASLIPFDDDFRAHLRDMLMSAYATGITKGGKRG